jgi:hypothetical protein
MARKRTIVGAAALVGVAIAVPATAALAAGLDRSSPSQSPPSPSQSPPSPVQSPAGPVQAGLLQLPAGMSPPSAPSPPPVRSPGELHDRHSLPPGDLLDPPVGGRPGPSAPVAGVPADPGPPPPPIVAVDPADIGTP